MGAMDGGIGIVYNEEKRIYTIMFEDGQKFVFWIVAGVIYFAAGEIAAHWDEAVALQATNPIVAPGGTGNGLEYARYAQNDFNQNFSTEGQRIYSHLAGQPIRSVNDLANAIKNGIIDPADIPINYIVRDGYALILNTRTAQALTQAGIPLSQWNAINQTGNAMFESMLTAQLARNGLTSSGTPTVIP